MSRLLCAAIVLAVTTAACGDSSPTTPTTPPVTIVTDTFPATPPGTLTPNGAVTHSFQTLTPGIIQATISSLSDTAAVVGFAIGTFNGTGCQLLITNDTAKLGTLITGQANDKGALCVRIYDATGKLTVPIEYTITVSHP